MLDETSQGFTAIRNFIGPLRYICLPQGLKNSPAVFQRIVTFTLGNRKGLDVWAFMDDVSLGTTTVEEHLHSVDAALETFYNAGARLKLAKCQLGVREAESLGIGLTARALSPRRLTLRRDDSSSSPV